MSPKLKFELKIDGKIYFVFIFLLSVNTENPLRFMRDRTGMFYLYS